jgi:hypothetical protein
MFALLAVIAFVLALFNVTVGAVNMVELGLLFIALHLLWPSVAAWRTRE